MIASLQTLRSPAFGEIQALRSTAVSYLPRVLHRNLRLDGDFVYTSIAGGYLYASLPPPGRGTAANVCITERHHIDSTGRPHRFTSQRSCFISPDAPLWQQEFQLRRFARAAESASTTESPCTSTRLMRCRCLVLGDIRQVVVAERGAEGGQGLDRTHPRADAGCCGSGVDVGG